MRFLKYIAVLLITALLLWRFNGVTPGNGDGAMTAEQIEARYGVHIGTGSADTFYMPPYGPADAQIFGGKVLPVEAQALGPALRGITDGLKAYPDGAYSGLSKAIFICGRLWLDGAEAGGTVGRSWIVIVADAADGDSAIYQTALYGVHHEFSSLIWRRSPAVALRWGQLLPQGWREAADNAEALARANDGAGNYALGFLSSYAETTIENDFNTFAEFAFVEPQRLIALASQYPLIAQKLGLFITAYEQYAPGFIPVFASLGLTNVAQQPTPLNVTVTIDTSQVIPERIR